MFECFCMLYVLICVCVYVCILAEKPVRSLLAALSLDC